LLLIAHSYNSISSSGKVTFAARTSAILVLKVHPLLSMNWRGFLVDSCTHNSLIPFARIVYVSLYSTSDSDNEPNNYN
jgi:hypothetical protein